MADAIVSGAVSVCKILHTCELCGKGFYPKRTNNNRFCGRGCGLQWASFKTAFKKNGGRVWVRVHRRKPKQKKHVDRETWLWPAMPRACAICGSAFAPERTGGRFPKFCSDECRASSRRAISTTSKRKREQVVRSSAIDRIDPLKVFERDAWRCQICGCKTPQSKRGTCQPSAPELDHIVSLANGGSHTWGNVQCACRSCNGRKGARSFGQLHLFPTG